MNVDPRLAGRPPGLGATLSQMVVGAIGLVLALFVALALMVAAVVLALVWLVRAAFAKLTGRPVGPWTALAGLLWTRWRMARSFGRRGAAAPGGARHARAGADPKAPPFSTRPGRLSDEVVDVVDVEPRPARGNAPAAGPTNDAP